MWKRHHFSIRNWFEIATQIGAGSASYDYRLWIDRTGLPQSLWSDGDAGIIPTVWFSSLGEFAYFMRSLIVHHFQLPHNSSNSSLLDSFTPCFTHVICPSFSLLFALFGSLFLLIYSRLYTYPLLKWTKLLISKLVALEYLISTNHSRPSPVLV